MTREEAIKLANDMAVFGTIWIDDQGNEVNDLVAFAQLVASNERDACAKIADEWAVGWPHPSTVISERIRARGQQ